MKVITVAPLNKVSRCWISASAKLTNAFAKMEQPMKKTHEHTLLKQLVVVNGFSMIAEFQAGLFMRRK